MRAQVRKNTEISELKNLVRKMKNLLEGHTSRELFAEDHVSTSKMKCRKSADNNKIWENSLKINEHMKRKLWDLFKKNNPLDFQ